MAFVLNAQLKIAAPTNLGQLRNQVQNSLNGLHANLKVNVQGLNNNALSQVNSQLKQLKTNVNAVNNLGTSLNRIGSSSNVASHGIASFSENIASTTRRLGAFIIAAQAFVQFNNLIVSSTKAFVAYQHEIVAIGQVAGVTAGQLGGDTAQQIGALDKNIRSLATRFGASSTDIAKAANVIRQAGIGIEDTNKIIETLAKTTNTPSFGNIETTAKNVIAIYHQFGSSAREVEESLNKINVLSKAYATVSSDYVEAVQRAGGSFKLAGGNLNELLALFTTVRETTQESAESIGTAFKTIFNRIQGADVVKQLADLDIQLRYTIKDSEKMGRNLTGEFVGPLEAIRRISEGLSKVSEQSEVYNSVITAIGGDRQLAKVIPLIKDFSKTQEVLNKLKGVGNSLDEDAAKAQASLQINLGKTLETFKSLFVELAGNKQLQDILNTTLQLTRSFLEMSKVLKPIVPLFAAFAAAKVVSTGFSVGSLLAAKAGAGPSRLAPRKLARGGYIDGPSVDQDVVDIKAMPGEFIINKRAAQAFGYDKLAKINNRQKFAQGGVIPVFREHENAISSSDIDDVAQTLGLRFSPGYLVNRVRIQHPERGHKLAIFGAQGKYSPYNYGITLDATQPHHVQKHVFAHELGHSIDNYFGNYAYQSKHKTLLDKYGDPIKRYASKYSVTQQRYPQFHNVAKSGQKIFSSNLEDYDESDHIVEGFADAFAQVYSHRKGTLSRSSLTNYGDGLSDEQMNLHAQSISRGSDFNFIVDKLNKRFTSKHRERFARDFNFAPGIEDRDFRNGLIDIKAMPGEFLINKDAAQQFGYDKLRKINKIQKFAKGGMVQSESGAVGFGDADVDEVLHHLGLGGIRKDRFLNKISLTTHIPNHDSSLGREQGYNGVYQYHGNIALSTRDNKRSKRDIQATFAHELGHRLDHFLNNDSVGPKYSDVFLSDKTKGSGNYIDRLSKLGQEASPSFLRNYHPDTHQIEGVAEAFKHKFTHSVDERPEILQRISNPNRHAVATSSEYDELIENVRNKITASTARPIPGKSGPYGYYSPRDKNPQITTPNNLFGNVDDGLHSQITAGAHSQFGSGLTPRGLGSNRPFSVQTKPFNQPSKLRLGNMRDLLDVAELVKISPHTPKADPFLSKNVFGSSVEDGINSQISAGQHSRLSPGLTPIGLGSNRQFSSRGNFNHPFKPFNQPSKLKLGNMRDLLEASETLQVTPNTPKPNRASFPTPNDPRITHIKGVTLDQFHRGFRSNNRFTGQDKRSFFNGFPAGQYQSKNSRQSNGLPFSAIDTTTYGKNFPGGPIPTRNYLDKHKDKIIRGFAGTPDFPYAPFQNKSGGTYTGKGGNYPPTNVGGNTPGGPPPIQSAKYLDVAKKLGFDLSSGEGIRNARDIFAHIGKLTPTGKSASHDINQKISPGLEARLSNSGLNNLKGISAGFGHKNVNQTLDLLAQHHNFTNNSNLSGKQFRNTFFPKLSGGQDRFGQNLSSGDVLSYIRAIDFQQKSASTSVPKNIGGSLFPHKYGDTSPIGTHGLGTILNDNPNLKRQDLHRQVQNYYQNNRGTRFSRFFNKQQRRNPFDLASDAIDNNYVGKFKQGKFVGFDGNPYGPDQALKSQRQRKIFSATGAFAVGVAGQIASDQLSGETKSGALTKGGLAGASAGLIAGAQFGGVPGAAAGALIGGVVGVTSSLKEFNKELQNKKFNESIKNASLALEKFAKSTDEAEEKVNLKDVIKNINQSEELLLNNTKGRTLGPLESVGQTVFDKAFGALDYLGFKDTAAKGRLGATSTLQEDPKELASLRKSMNGGIIQMSSDALDRAQQNYLRRNVGKQINPEAFLQSSGVSALITKIATNKNLGDDKAIAKDIADQRAKITKDLTQQSKVDHSYEGADLIKTNFGELLKSVDAVSASFHALQQSTSGITAIFEGVAPQHLNTKDQTSLFGTSRFGDFAQKSLSGIVDPNTLKQITDTSHLQEVVSRVLSNLDPTNIKSTEDGKSATEQFQKALERYGVKGSVNQSATTYFAADPLKYITDARKKNPQKVAEDFTKGALPGTSEFVKELAGKRDEIVNQFSDQYSQGISQRNTGIENKFRKNELSDQFAEFSAQRKASFAGRSNDVLSFLPTNHFENTFNQRQNDLGAIGNNARNPDAIAKQLIQTQSEIERETVTRVNAPAGKAQLDSSKKLVELRSKAQNLGKALENLTDVSKTSAGAIAKLGRIQEDRDAKRSFTEQYLSADTAGREQINRAAGITSNVIANGSLRGFDAESQQSTISFLRSVGKGSLGFAGGATGEDVLKQLLDEFNRGSGLQSEESSQEAVYNSIIQGNYEVAIRAQSNLSGILESTNERFISDLGSKFDTWLAGLQEIIRGSGGSAPPGFARGGPVGTDTVPAMLSPGEFIVSRKAAQKHKKLLHNINNGNDTQYLASGGFVPRNNQERAYGRPDDLGLTNNVSSKRKKLVAARQRINQAEAKFNAIPSRVGGAIKNNAVDPIVMPAGRLISKIAKGTFDNTALPILQGVTALTNYGFHSLRRDKTKSPSEQRQEDLDAFKEEDQNRVAQYARDDTHRNTMQGIQDNSASIQSRLQKSIAGTNESTAKYEQFRSEHPLRPNPAAISSTNNGPSIEELNNSATRSRAFVAGVNQNQGIINSGDYSQPLVKGRQPAPSEEPTSSPLMSGLQAFRGNIAQKYTDTIAQGSGREVENPNTIYGKQSLNRMAKYGDETLKEQAHRERQDTIKRRRDAYAHTNGAARQYAINNGGLASIQNFPENSNQGNNGQSQFGEQSKVLAQAFGQFSKDVSPLVDGLNSLKDAKVTLEQNGNLNVNINGLETLKNLSSAIQNSIMADVLKQTAELIDKKIAELNSGPSI